jgi:hypothetical protein
MHVDNRMAACPLVRSSMTISKVGHLTKDSEGALTSFNGEAM